jgi:hypothetical protein
MKIRTILALVLPVLAALALSVSQVAFGAPAATADQGQPIIAGQTNTETAVTIVENTSTSGSTAGIYADSQGGGFAVSGETGGPASAVYGQNDNSGNGVEGVTFGSQGAGVYGENDASGNGIYGHAANSAASGVYGQNDGAGYGVAGRASSGIGALGDSANGIGVWASSQNATALKVSGKAQFSRSGVVTVTGTPSAPKKSVKVSLPITAKSMMTALLQKYVAGVYVVAAVPNVSGGFFTIYLNKAVSTSVGPIAWMVTERP